MHLSVFLKVKVQNLGCLNLEYVLDIPDIFGGDGRCWYEKKIECLLWEATELVKLKFYIVLPWHEDTKVCISCPSYIIKITTITIFSRHSYFFSLA